jgi:5-methyltetrahydrofolate--homocysteine methyltransferase
VEYRETIFQGILDGMRETVEEGTSAALAGGASAGAVLEEAMIPAMAEVGRLFEAGEYFVPELLISARAMKAGLAILRPLLVATGVEYKGRVAIGSSHGDMHDIGKNLVAMMLEGAGFEVFDLGVDVSPERFIAAVLEKKAQAIALSSLVTTTMPSMRRTIEALKEAGLRDRVKVIIGGAPVTQKYADEIGADGYSKDAGGAADLVKRLLSIE